MTIEELANMEYPLGMPIAWVFDPNGNMLKDKEGRPISRYLTEFEYTYDEEEDDQCSMTFQFDAIEKYDLPYFDHDIILLVQWGFITPGGEVIKGPKRKVAVRDITTDYSQKGFTLTLECTDLVAYLKAYNSRTIRKGGLIGKIHNNFLGYIKELVNGQFTATVTNDKKSVHFNSRGGTTVSDYDPVENKMKNSVRDATAIGDKFYYELHSREVIKGKGKSVDNGIRELLEGMKGISNGEPANLVLDGTDDNISIRPRNFDQKLFKAFLWQNGLRNFIDFQNKTDTRKVEEDKATSSDINPYNKESETTQVNYADSEEEEGIQELASVYELGAMDSQEKEEEIARKKIGKLLKIIKSDGIPKEEEEGYNKVLGEYKETLKIERDRKEDSLKYVGFADQLLDNYKYNMDNPTEQEEPGNLTYSGSLDIENKGGSGDIYIPEKLKFKVEASAILNDPGFEDELDNRKKELNEKYKKLFNKGIEKIQRKHEASATVMGDPSLIKARTYGFFGLSKKDSGKWYCNRVTHKISTGNGYVCQLDLLKKPKTIGVVELKFKEKRELLSEDEILNLNRYLSSEVKIVSKGTGKLTSEELKDVETDTLRGINDRIEVLNASDDYKTEQ